LGAPPLARQGLPQQRLRQQRLRQQRLRRQSDQEGVLRCASEFW
jgi:hypothetical protein